jgi:hypothetical protein
VRALATNNPPTIIQQKEVILAVIPGRHSPNEGCCSTDDEKTDEILYNWAGISPVQ